MQRTLTLVCAAMVCGCTAGPNFIAPAPPAATGYLRDRVPSAGPQTGTTSQHVELGQVIAGDWWSLFRSDPINGIVTQAVAHNRTLVASAATLAQAQELALAQSGTRYPQVGLTAARNTAMSFWAAFSTCRRSPTLPSARRSVTRWTIPGVWRAASSSSTRWRR
jgi:outer membrane protein TolC